MKQREQALLLPRKAAQDEALLDEVLDSAKWSLRDWVESRLRVRAPGD